jgi:hypothetical protein
MKTHDRRHAGLPDIPGIALFAPLSGTDNREVREAEGTRRACPFPRTI